MEWQTIVISAVALLISTVTAALNLFSHNKRDHYSELDNICTQQWAEIDNLKVRYEESEQSKETLRRELETLRADSRRNMDVTSARIESGVAIARLAVAESAKTANSLSEISEVSKATHKIVNNQRTVMLRQVAVLSRLYARDHLEDKEAQVAAEQAESDLLNATTVG